jgi:dipeptidyl aminopeptidase/acylaminoacyl peptidase
VGHVEVRDSAPATGRVVARYGPTEGAFLTGPRWRPGADEILLFYPTGEGVAERDELVIVDGLTATRRSIQTPTSVRSADWSADGRRITYGSLEEVRVVNADGSNDRALFQPVPSSSGDQAIALSIAAFSPR